MSQSIWNIKKWTRDDIRLLVVLLLTFIYPVFVSSFFALYIFVLLPVMLETGYSRELAHQDGYFHYYWLFVAVLWVVLCAVILPCFRDKTKNREESIGMDVRGSPSYPTKPHTVQPFVQVEEGVVKDRDSILTGKSENSSDSIEKEIFEEKAEKESIEKSREILQGSQTSLERKRITQSGEFLNDFLDSVEPNDVKKGVTAVCEVHAEDGKDTKSEEKDDKDKENGEKAKKDVVDKDEDNKNQCNTEDEGDEDSSTSDEKMMLKGKEEKDKINQENLDKDKSNPSPEDLTDAPVEPNIIPENVKSQQMASPVQTEEAKIMKGQSSEDQEEEVEELDEDIPKLRTKARPTIDTSRTSGYYECSMPTPSSADCKRPESNVVFLFVNPESLSTEEGIIVEQAGEVEEDDTESRE